MTRRMRTVALAVAALTAVLAFAGSAQAFTTPPVWQCRASAVYASVAGQNRVEPIVANGNINTAEGRSPDRAQCVSSEAGAGNAVTQIGVPQDLLAARTARAVTTIEPELGRAIDQRVAAVAGVEDLTLQLPQGGTVVLGVAVANSMATASCAGGVPQLQGTSQVTGITLGGQTVSADALLVALQNALAPLGALVDIKVNEQVRDAGSLTVRALHIRVLRDQASPLLDVVVAESKVGFSGPVCDPNQQNDGSGSGSGDGDGFGQCPDGSTFDAGRRRCVIVRGSGDSQTVIIVGRAFEGPGGGRVVPLNELPRSLRRSVCARVPGPAFAIVGTNRADRITGTNRTDRIFTLGGNDRVEGGRGDDCVKGGTGRDVLSGALGRDRLYGESGKDSLIGGSNADVLSAGSGNDTINGGFGRDRISGGSGRDFINAATAGPAKRSINCGSGSDKVRINRNERRRVRGCEVVYVIR